MKDTWYQLPEDQCERLKKSEMSAVMWSLSAVNSVAYGRDDLHERLQMIPNGRKRWNLMLGQLRSLVYDLLGTVPERQCKSIKNSMTDLELRMVPKHTPSFNRVTMDANDLTYIIKAAKEQVCTSCIMNGDECRKCEMYKILVCISPKEDYGNGTMCPYMKKEWWDQGETQ